MSKAKTKKLVVFTIGGKGGVGKSWVVVLLVDWYGMKGVQVRVVDLDNENNTLSRFCKNAEFIDVAHEKDLDALINSIVEGEHALTLMDMRAASTDRIQPWLKQVDFDALTREHGVSFTAVGVVDSSEDSVGNIGIWAKEVLGGAKGMRFVIAQNKVRGEELSYTTSKARENYREKLNVVEIEIPKLEAWVHAELEKADLSVGAAAEVEDPASPFTKFMTRSRLRKYREAVFQQFETVKDRLLP